MNLLILLASVAFGYEVNPPPVNNQSISPSSVTISNLDVDSVVFTQTGGLLNTVSTFSYVGGQVGIGTASPGATLHVVGTSSTTGDSTVGGVLKISPTGNIIGDSANPVIRLSDSAGTLIGYGASSVTITNGVIQAIVGAAEIARINATGFGIGSISPAQKLQVSSGTILGDGTGAAIQVDGTATFAAIVSSNAANPNIFIQAASGQSAEFRVYDNNSAAGSRNFGFKTTQIANGDMCVTMGASKGAAPGGCIMQYSSGGVAVSDTGANASLTAGNGFQVGSSSMAVTSGGYFKPYPRTLAQIVAMTPAAGDLGGIVTCTNCDVAYSVCTATGTTVQGFKLGVSGALAECK